MYVPSDRPFQKLIALINEYVCILYNLNLIYYLDRLNTIKYTLQMCIAWPRLKRSGCVAPRACQPVGF